MTSFNPSRFKTNIALRLQRRATGAGRFAGASSDADGVSVDRLGVDKASAGMDAEEIGNSYEVISDAEPVADNDDVWKRRFTKRGMTRLKRNIRNGLRWTRETFKALSAYIADLRSERFSRDEKIVMLKQFKRWDPDALDAHRRAKAEEDLFRFHKEQAQLLKHRIIEVLTNLGFCYHITKNDRKYIKKKVFISQVDISPFAYTFHITRMPFGVRVTEIAQDWVAAEIAASIGKKMRYELDLNGLRITVEVGSTLSIPNFVGFGDLDDKTPMPKNLPPLAMWLGLSANGAPVYRNLADAPHMIIAGSSGGGKSNMENTIACTLIRNNPPARLRMVFFDLKGGVEFSQYENIPHLWKMEREKWSSHGIVEYPADVIPALKVLFDECMRRLDILKKAGVKNVGEYNRKKRTNLLPYIVVMFDEWASTRKMVGEEAEKILSNIANLSRAAGIHFILSTQYPKAEILNTMISVNFPWRIAFNMNSGASQSVLGSWDAVGLTPTGRAIFQSVGDPLQVQTPRITNQNVIDIVTEAVSGVKMTKNMQNVDAMDILEWAINKSGGKLDQDSVFNQFKEKITSQALRELLRSMEDETYDVNGTLYKVLPGAGPLSRRMVLAEEAGMSAEVASHIPHPTTETEINKS